MILPAPEWLAFAGVALLMVLAPGPNMAYLVSRTLAQGRRAGLQSLLGVAAAFLLHLAATAGGIAAILVAVPVAYEALRWAGAAYLLALAVRTLATRASSGPCTPALAPESARRLFAMGFLTNLLNPKAAALYLAILPQFVSPERGSVLAQALLLGLTQIAISFTVNLAIVFAAAAAAQRFARRSRWLAVQRHAMAAVLAGLALRLALEPSRPG